MSDCDGRLSSPAAPAAVKAKSATAKSTIDEQLRQHNISDEALGRHGKSTSGEIREDVSQPPPVLSAADDESSSYLRAKKPVLAIGDDALTESSPIAKANDDDANRVEKKPVFRNCTSATFLVASNCGRGVLKASWTGPSSSFKRSGPTKLPN